MRTSQSILLLSCLYLSSPLTAHTAPAKPISSQWRLVWSDDFERAELGTNWFARRGKALLRDGRLLLTGAGATLLTERTFGPDVKLEFVAEANPNLPPCDLSATLCANRLFGWTYLLAFGGNHNQVNQILGGSQPVVDKEPPWLIEPGRKYHLVALKEGQRLACFVDNQLILEAQDDDPLGGPGFDRVGLITWNGMLVDEVKVFERASPAPNGPIIIQDLPSAGFQWSGRAMQYRGPLPHGLSPAVDAYNRRQYREAFELFAKVSPPTLHSVVGLACVLGDLSFEHQTADQQQLATLAAEVAKLNADDANAKTFAQAAEWFHRISIRSRDRRAVTRLVSIGPKHNPFYYKAALFRARYHYASAKEGADQRRIREALDLFAELKTIWPDNLALREFSGDAVIWREDLIRAETDGPPWARHLQEVLARQHAILDWWFTQRQAPDGSLGGGWGDDVEILRSWVPAACISTAGKTAVEGIERLAEGVWNHVLKGGYEPGIGDVEHSAEPSADALPTMLLLRYGDPLWVERNLESARTIRNRFMARNQRGHLQFISSEFGADGVNTHPRAGGDTGYHARAMKHFLWLAWFGVPEAQEVFLDWCDTWRETTLARMGMKPPGFAPASIFYPAGTIEPPTGQSWYVHSAHYYGFPGLPTLVHDSFLAAFFLSRDRRFLEPVQAMLELATTGPLTSYNDELPPDHPLNLRSHVVHQATPDITALYHWLTQDQVYDEYTLRHPSPRQRYEIDGDRTRYETCFQKLAESLRYRWTQRTSEVLQTDRAGLQGAQEVLGAYTGAVRDFRDAATPTMSVTWMTPDLNFAALVTETTAERLRVNLYNFNSVTSRIALRPWRLVPGTYGFSTGEILAAEAPMLKRYGWSQSIEVEIRRRADPVWFDLPPGKEWVVDLRLKQSRPKSVQLPDLAIGARDIQVERDTVSITVHNLGSVEVPSGRVVLEASDGSEWKLVHALDTGNLKPIQNLLPSAVTMTFTLPQGSIKHSLRVRVDPEDEIHELLETNNRFEWR